MKILYVANERRPSELAAIALRDIAPDIRFAWAGRFSAAQRWVEENPDIAALVVEAEVENQSCASFVHHLRSHGLTAPIIVVAPEEMGTPTAALKAGADDYVANNKSLLPNLRDIVNRALQRAETMPHPMQQPLRVLYLGRRRARTRVSRESSLVDRDHRSCPTIERHISGDSSAFCGRRSALI